MNPTGFAQATAHAETGADLAIIPGALVSAEVFADGGVDRILADLKARAKAEPVDISTPQGRASLKSLCYKIARSKTALDGMGKDLGEDHHARWTAINKDRKRIRDELDALNEEIRAPLTEWETRDADRIEGHETNIAKLAALSDISGDDPAIETIEALIGAARRRFEDREWEEFSRRAEDTMVTTVSALMRLRDRWSNVYAERAEAERLRAEEAARVQRERDAAIAAAAAAQARREAEAMAEAAREAEAERVRREAAAAEARRLAEVRARQEAEERARQAEASRRASAQRAKIDYAAAAQRAEQQRIETAAKAEQDRLAAIANERRLIEEERLAAARDAAAREANTRHRAKVNREARDAIKGVMADEIIDGGLSAVDIARLSTSVVEAIAKGLIPHTRITY